MKHEKKFIPREHQPVSETRSQHTEALEFATPEELLRHDAGQIEVPPAVAKRLDDSIRRESKPARPWWKRLAGG